MRILFVNYTMNIGGIESFLLNITKELKAHNIDVDFLCYHQEPFDLENELNKLNCHIYHISDPDHTPSFKHLKQIKKVLKENKYDIIHSNTYTDSGFVMLAAFLAGIKVRVTHSHTSQKPTSFKQRIKWFLMIT